MDLAAIVLVLSLTGAAIALLLSLVRRRRKKRKAGPCLVAGGILVLIAMVAPALLRETETGGHLSPEEATKFIVHHAQMTLWWIAAERDLPSRPTPRDLEREIVAILRRHKPPKLRIILDERGQILDGWGRPLRFLWQPAGGPRMCAAYYCYSVGPNGRDDRAKEDDFAEVPIPDSAQTLAAPE